MYLTSTKEVGCVSINANNIRRCRYLISFSYFHIKCGSPSISRTDTQPHHLKHVTSMLHIAWWQHLAQWFWFQGKEIFLLHSTQWTEEGLNWLPSSFHVNDHFKKFWPDFSKQSDVIVLLSSTPNELTSGNYQQVNNRS